MSYPPHILLISSSYIIHTTYMHAYIHTYIHTYLHLSILRFSDMYAASRMVVGVCQVRVDCNWVYVGPPYMYAVNRMVLGEVRVDCFWVYVGPPYSMPSVFLRDIRVTLRDIRVIPRDILVIPRDILGIYV